MRKLLLFLLILLFFGINNSFAGWYGNTAVTYGTTTVKESCSADGDTAGGTPTGYDNDTAVTDTSTSLTPNPIYNTYALNSGNTNAIDIASSGTMYCLKWDGAAPTCGTWSEQTSWSNSSVTMTLASSTDAGGSGISTSGGTCSITNLSGTCNFNVSDVAGNITTCTSPVVTKLDTKKPTVSNNYSYNNVWKSLGSQTITLSPVDTGGSGISTTKWCEGAGCTPGTVGTSIIKTAPYNNTIRYQTWDVAGNASTIGSFVVKLDITKPTISDIGNSTPVDNSNLLAINSKNFSVTVGINGGSPITKIEGYFEDQATTNSYLSKIDSSIGGTLSIAHSIRDVDSDRVSSSGYRQYSFKITKICDEATNCISDINGIKTFNYNVYANTSNTFISKKEVNLTHKNDLIATNNVANGTSHPLTVTLKDFDGNQIVPASGINRTIDFNFDVNNNTNLDQYNKTGDAIYLTTPNDSNYTNKLTINKGIKSFTGQTSSNGQYPFNFKVYAPTYSGSATDGRQYVDGNFKINDISVDINSDIGARNNISLTNAQNIDFQFRPLYYTKLTGSIKDYGFIEGATQTGIININKYGTTTTTTNSLNIEFGSGANKLSSSFDMIYYKSLTQTSIVGEGYANMTKITTNLSKNYNLKTLITQNGIISNLSSSYLSTHIGYNIIGPNLSNINVLYNSDIIGKSRYSLASTTNTVTQVGLKVIGKTFSDKQTNITQTQQASNFNILGNISKASLRRDIVKNAYNIIRNAPLSNGNKKIDKLSSLGWTNTDGKKLQNDKILYFGGLNGSNVTLDLSQRLMNIKLQGKKTIIVKGGNLYIKSNIVNKNNNNILGIIVLKDENGKGGYVYIDPSVTEIDSVIYVDRSVVSYDGTNILDGITNQSVLRNQLYIKGSIFSYNTIGGSRANPIICPYYITGLCDRTIAQTYDFNYLRRYFLYDTTGNLIGDTPANGGSSVLQPTDPNYKYPIVIEYNPVVQTGPPPLFYK